MEHMKKLLIIAALAGAALPAVNATLITGSLTYSDGAVFDASIFTATQVTDFKGGAVQSADGDFSSIPVLTPVSVDGGDGWAFNTVAPGISGFFSVGGFTFDLTESSVVYQLGGFVGVQATGFISHPGFDTTPAVLNFTSQEPTANGVGSYSASLTALPDGGNTLITMGMAFTVCGALASRRRILA